MEAGICLASYKLISMTPIPVAKKYHKNINALIKKGESPNGSVTIRHNDKISLEDEAVHSILMAMREPDIKGDLDDLAKKYL